VSLQALASLAGFDVFALRLVEGKNPQSMMPSEDPPQTPSA
jgi:hypothetical protein